MKIIKYFFEFVIIITLFFIFRIIGLRNASDIGSLLGRTIGPLFRSKNIITGNIRTAFGEISEEKMTNIISGMWSNIGRTFAEYVFLKKFRSSESNFDNIKINGAIHLDEIKKSNKPVIFYSGHFANFELMLMTLDKLGMKCVGIYRPLNNFFLNPVLEYLRIKYCCKNLIPKTRMGLREIINKVNNGYSITLMVDQRVSEGPKVPFFDKPAHTTTIPAQLALKYNCKLVPIFLERKDGINFEMTVHEPYTVQKTNNNEEDIKNITIKMNQIIEKMIVSNPRQWIWSHNRWK